MPKRTDNFFTKPSEAKPSPHYRLVLMGNFDSSQSNTMSSFLKQRNIEDDNKQILYLLPQICNDVTFDFCLVKNIKDRIGYRPLFKMPNSNIILIFPNKAEDLDISKRILTENIPSFAPKQPIYYCNPFHKDTNDYIATQNKAEIYGFVELDAHKDLLVQLSENEQASPKATCSLC